MLGRKKHTNETQTSRGENMSRQVDTLIGAGTIIKGDLEFSGGLHIDGELTGSIKATEASATLTLSQTGKLEGEIHAPHVVLDGTVEGDLHASEKLELAGNARIHGNVYYNLIEIAVGAEINGQLIRKTPDGNDTPDFLKKEDSE